MMRLMEVMVFGSLATGLHLAALSQWPGADQGGQPARTGAPVEMAIATPSAALRQRIADWDRPPAGGASPAAPAALSPKFAPILPGMPVPVAGANDAPGELQTASLDVAPAKPTEATRPPLVTPAPLSRPVVAAVAPPGTSGTVLRQPAQTAPNAALRADLAASHGAAVRQALTRAQNYPAGAKARGVTGIGALQVTIGRDGRLVAARLTSSSGSRALDEATLTAARRARFPTAPKALSGSTFSYVVRLRYDLN